MEIDGGPSFDGTNMLAFVDALFAQNVDEYSNHPENLMKDVKERCSPYFKNCKSLNARGCIADHGELVRMRCMIQDVKGAEIFLASGIADADEQNATERPVCGILRDTITCSSVKEVVAMRTRYNYTVVPVPGATDWFIELFHGPSSALGKARFMTSGSDGNSGNASSLSSPASSLKSFAVKAKFFCESAEDLLPNHIFDLYGVMDKTAIIHTDDHDAFGEMLLVELPRVHVIQFEAVEHHDFIALASPEVQVIELAASMLSDEMFIPVMDHERDVLKQGPLQLTNGTLLILDETELSSGVMRLAGNAEKNIAALRCIVSSQKVDYDYVFYQLPLHCDINVLILSRHPSVIIEVPFTVALPPQFTDGLDPTVEMIRSAQGQMDCRRHALLTSRKAVKDVEITDSINKVIEDGFMRMRESSSREDAGAQLHRLLTISRLLAAIDRKKEVDEECWNKARTMEVKRRVGLAELLR
ncbi:unnamed protein product [Toxocara canis]|uniref:Mini-chromosome maintenance complex-binding protein n=1 Tax=Toxocara canis TaxID=6265 RepID=A0A183V473_TOXCA|nr:unnamed protein product [Toxocara canis]